MDKYYKAAKSLDIPAQQEEPTLKFPRDKFYINSKDVIDELVERTFKDSCDMNGRPYILHLRDLRDRAWWLWKAPWTTWIEYEFNRLNDDIKHGGQTMRCIEYTILMVAYAHDILNSKSVKKEDLEALKIPDLVIDNIEILTKPEDMTEDEYYYRLKQYPIARLVKIAHLIGETDLTRYIIEGIKEDDIQRTEHYLLWLEYLVTD